MTILKRGIYLIIFCLPLYLVRLQVFKIPTTVLELMLYGLFMLWIIKRGYKGLWMALKHERLLIWGIVLLVIGVSIATIFSWDIRLSAGIWKAWFSDAILFFLMFVSIIKKENLKNVFNAWIFSGFVVAIISLIYLIQGNFNYQGRLQGIFDSPNFLAMYIAPILIILLGKIYSLRKTTSQAECMVRTRPRISAAASLGRMTRVFVRIGFSLTAILFFAIIFFTKSYGAWLGILGALVFGAVVYLYKRNKKILVLSIILIGFVLVLIAGLSKIKSLEGLQSFDARFEIWKTAINSFISYPITGIGPGTFQDYFPPYPKWGVPQPHNIFLAFLLQTGLVGFVGFMLILVWFFSSCGRPTVGWRQLVIVCLMIYILAHGLVDTTYWKNDLAIMFWMIIGMMAIIRKSYNFIE
jgi:O-antigen ligase